MKKKIFNYLRNISAKADSDVSDRLLLSAISVYRKVRGALERTDNRILSNFYLRSKSIERDLMSWKYRFVTLAELVMWTNDWVRSFPTTYDVIVGIPRSGSLVAHIVALKLGKPVTTPDLLNENQYWMTPQGRRTSDHKRILLIDDSISKGEKFRETLAMVRSTNPEWDVATGALIVTPEAKHLVDLYYSEIPQPRLFEWNMLHVKKGFLASDLDGVICDNCPPGVDADHARYEEWIRSAKPYLIPTFEIDVILSSRLECYRRETEEWLARYGVRYRELMLWEIGSKREASGKHAQHKIEKLLRIKPEMFWESSLVQAREIWRATKIPTLCIDEMRLFA